MSWTERYVRSDAAGGGNGTTDANSGANGAWTLAEGITNASGGMRINVKAGTYSNTTTSRTFSVAGTTTAPIWWRGFKTTAGDMDGFTTSHGTFASGTEVPAITFTTGRFIVSGAHQIFSNLHIQGAQTTNGQVRCDAGSLTFVRVMAECTSANANGRAFDTGTAGAHLYIACWFKSTSSADVASLNQDNMCIIGTQFISGNNSLGNFGAVDVQLIDCVFSGSAADCIRAINANSTLTIKNCTFYNVGGDAIEVTTAVTSICVIGNCVFSNITGYGINNSSGGTLNTIRRFGNLFYSCTSGNETGFGDTPSWAEQSDSGSPFVNAASGNLSITDGSNAISNALPRLFANELMTSYKDIGAAQRQPAGTTNVFIRRGSTVMKM